MSWLAQVRHVAWKDIRQSRWILLVYVLIVTLATEQIVGPIDVEVSFLPTTLLLVLLGIAGSAVFVQSDSPSRSDAFWASRPFYGSALAAEKVTMLVLLLAIGLGGEIIALEAFHVATGEFVATLAASVLTYGAWLLAAAMLGAVTRDLRTFTVSIIVVVVVSGIAGTTLLSGHAQEPVIRLLAFIGAVLGLIVFTLMYERRTRSRALWVLAVVAVLAELVPVFAVGVEPTLSESPPADRALRLQLLQTPTEMSKSNLLIVRAQLDDLPDSLLVGMRCDSAVMHFQDGTSTRLANQNGLVSMTVPASTPDNPVGWLSGKFSASADTRLTFVLNRTAANALQRGVRSIDVFGRVVESQPHVDGSLPLHAGAQLTRDGARIRIVRIVHTPDSLNVTIRMHSLAHSAQPMAWPGTMTMAPLEPRFALVNARRGAAMPLFSGRGSGGASWLVLPGAPLSEWESDLVPGGGFGRQEWTPDDAWYRGAQLVAIRWDSRASYQVHGSIVGGS